MSDYIRTRSNKEVKKIWLQEEDAELLHQLLEKQQDVEEQLLQAQLEEGEDVNFLPKLQINFFIFIKFLQLYPHRQG